MKNGKEIIYRLKAKQKNGEAADIRNEVVRNKSNSINHSKGVNKKVPLQHHEERPQIEPQEPQLFVHIRLTKNNYLILFLFLKLDHQVNNHTGYE